MDANVSPPAYWWMKGKNQAGEPENIPLLNITSNLSTVSDTLVKDHELDSVGDAECDIGSIIEEINKLAAKSPLGPYDKDAGERSVEDIMREAEQIFMESSKSFEQLSARSKTSANLSNSFNEIPNSTPSLKSASPLPLDNPGDYNHNDDYYSDDFTEGEDSPVVLKMLDDLDSELKLRDLKLSPAKSSTILDQNVATVEINNETIIIQGSPIKNTVESDVLEKTFQEQITEPPKPSPRITLNIKNSNTFATDTKLEKALEALKDARESNNALQIQLNDLTHSYQLLRISHDDTLKSNNTLNNRILERESILEQYKVDLESTQEHLSKFLEIESNLNKLLEMEKLQLKSAKLQNEKDARCILDLNRQVKEMERIIARKHPDSVSALIVAAKNDDVDNNLTTKRFLEERVKNLENEVVIREQQSSKIFLEVQEKFTEMKNKYESHIEDLELHVADLKEQLKRKSDTFEIYTQTLDEQDLPAKDTKNSSSQTTYISQRLPHNGHPPPKKPERNEKEDAHLLATIRGLQADLVNKEKTITKLQRELDETKKTIRRLQKEREGSLKNVSDKREFRSYPEKLVTTSQCNNCKQVEDLDDELRLLKADRDKIKEQLCRIEEDYQQLKSKRLFDLSALQQAHENEIATYISNITPLQKQLEIQQSTIALLEEQLKYAKLKALEDTNLVRKRPDDTQGSYQIHSISSKSVTQRSISNVACTQCALRQEQLITYKTELDQLLATVQALT